MPVYEVTVERVHKWTFNIQADNEEDARHEAKVHCVGYERCPQVSRFGEVSIVGKCRNSTYVNSIARPGECPTDICDCR